MMNRRGTLAIVFVFVMFLGACSKKTPQPQVVVEIPAGFNGNFVLEMGTRTAPPLPVEGDAYVVAVPRDGKVTTSTFLEKPKVIFRNASDGSVWGYSQSMFTTGDGISVGGKIEFFVGSKTQYDAEQNKKKHSGTSSVAAELYTSG